MKLQRNIQTPGTDSANNVTAQHFHEVHQTQRRNPHCTVHVMRRIVNGVMVKTLVVAPREAS